MIYTLTLNTSLDYVIHIDELKTGRINKSDRYNMYPGGKGINVSQVLKELGVDSKAMGFVAGHTGECLESMLSDIGICTDFVYLSEGLTRVNVKIRIGEMILDQVEETDINLAGPVVSGEEMERLRSRISCAEAGDIVIVSGSVPPSITADDFGTLLCGIAENGAKLVVDATGDYLKAALSCHPFLVKPNKEELEEFLGISIDEGNISDMARKLIDMGAENVLISLGEKGGLLCTAKGENIYMEAPAGKVVNTVGAGDSMVAGFIAGYSEKKEYDYAMKLAISAGSATAFCDGLASMKDIKAVFEDI